MSKFWFILLWKLGRHLYLYAFLSEIKINRDITSGNKIHPWIQQLIIILRHVYQAIFKARQHIEEEFILKQNSRHLGFVASLPRARMWICARTNRYQRTAQIHTVYQQRFP